MHFITFNSNSTCQTEPSNNCPQPCPFLASRHPWGAPPHLSLDSLALVPGHAMSQVPYTANEVSTFHKRSRIPEILPWLVFQSSIQEGQKFWAIPACTENTFGTSPRYMKGKAVPDFILIPATEKNKTYATICQRSQTTDIQTTQLLNCRPNITTNKTGLAQHRMPTILGPKGTRYQIHAQVSASTSPLQ